jgi:hypothetical protein
MKISMEEIKPARYTSLSVKNKIRNTSPLKSRLNIKGLTACIGSSMPNDAAMTASVGYTANKKG